MKVGCAQGSTLGPKLFSIYCDGLSSVLDHKVIAYADDAYVIISGNSVEELRLQANHLMEKHANWLTSIGMVVNIAKTEAVIFSRNHIDTIKLSANNVQFHTKSSMRVLGVEFVSHFRWDKHVDNVVSSAKRLINGLQILRHNLGVLNFAG